MVRHTSPDVEKGIVYGHTNVGLKESFISEAGEVKRCLKEMSFSSVWSSPSSRCRRLADFCGFREVHISTLLMEMNFGEWEMKKYSDIDNHTLDEYYKDWQHFKIPGGESFMEQGERVARFINDRLTTGERSVLAFAHGGTILHAMILAGMVESRAPFDHTPPFGGIVTLEFLHPIQIR